MAIDVKICGLRTPEAVDKAVQRGASHLGFIFFGPSPRNIEPDDAARLADRVRGRTKIVAVTVDADNDMLDEIVSQLDPDLLQLHGHETADRVLEVGAIYGKPIIKAFSVREADDLRGLEAYQGIVERFLFDAKAPKGSLLPGGNGVSFDWRLLAALDGKVDYMLSGGLNADNIGEALSLTGAHAVDVSSGVESAPGVKDLSRMDAFFDALDAATADERARSRM
ncbi:phosphoribosylanthranilate isomerase [Rhizobium sp. CC-YZS058]|uniref:phosphoribosylanthranilate isomerase n=1 Tax=Rhizobium sp. CC-YZS058 TaxID=3042153 RepID=UPI002B05B82E|nr:phosphoribosylanthranilate isomerase [Rhizobium sp. CC-YZS058]MEA3536840.1 phosphoribosylanthranilate isomerase [Rhizobium sp. CC-YZS058]